MAYKRSTFLLLLWFCSLQVAADTLYKCKNQAGLVAYTNNPAEHPDKTCDALSYGNASDGVIKLAKNRDGHFYVDGAVNGAKVRFLIDTGASGVTLNRITASQANVSGTRRVVFNTAGGEVSGTIASDIPVSIANLPPIKIAVAVNPSLDNATNLLGQGYLKWFKVTAQGTTMELVLQ